MKRQLTVLQRNVIERLREAHNEELADSARAAWTRAERFSLAFPIADPELLADFEKANCQLLTGFTDRRLNR